MLALMAALKQIQHLPLEIIVKLRTKVYLLVLLFSELPHSILELVLQSVLDMTELKVILLFAAEGPQVEAFLQV